MFLLIGIDGIKIVIKKNKILKVRNLKKVKIMKKIKISMKDKKIGRDIKMIQNGDNQIIHSKRNKIYRKIEINYMVMIILKVKINKLMILLKIMIEKMKINMLEVEILKTTMIEMIEMINEYG